VNWYTDDGWHHKEDPHGILPVGFKSRHGQVLGFCSPAGPGFKRLMVVVERGGGATTMRYLDALREYLEWLSTKEFSTGF